MKKVLITGANGLLGQKLVEMLLPFSNQYQIIATARGDNRAKITEGYIYEKLDITNIDELNTIFQKLIRCRAISKDIFVITFVPKLLHFIFS